MVSRTSRHIQIRNESWQMGDLVIQRNKTRRVPMSSWAEAALNTWIKGAPVAGEDAPLFRAVNNGGRVAETALTPQAVHKVVRGYAAELGLGEIAPHDLRRTLAKLAH